MGIAVSPATSPAVLVALLDRIALEPQNLTSIEALDEGIDRHLADSLAGLSVPELAGASACVDLGSGGGFPGSGARRRAPGDGGDAGRERAAEGRMAAPGGRGLP